MEIGMEDTLKKLNPSSNLERIEYRQGHQYIASIWILSCMLYMFCWLFLVNWLRFAKFKTYPVLQSAQNGPSMQVWQFGIKEQDIQDLFAKSR